MKRTYFSTVRKCAKGVKVFHQNLLAEHQMDPIAEKEMEELNGRVSPLLYGMLMQLIRGFDEDMQLEMADDLLDFAKYHVAHTTGVDAADIILDICYKLIAYDHDIMKKGERSRLRNVLSNR